jgi:hypothetical protein
VTEAQLKTALRSALIEVLEGRSHLLRDVVVDAMEDVALMRAIQAGEASGYVSRAEVFRSLEREA